MPTKFSKIQGWFDFDDVYNIIIDSISDRGHIAEVGCWLGKSTLYLAELIEEKKKDITVHAIDTWEGSDEETHKTLIESFGGPDKLFLNFKNNICQYEHIIRPMIATSLLASMLFKDNTLDAIYIDADHRYENVKEDVLAWLPKVKVGGYIGGHDYNRNSCMDVVRAVDEIFGDKISIHRNSWLYKKEKE